jgi:hypothetical protein
MIQFQEAMLADQLPEIKNGEAWSLDGTLPRRARPRSSNLDNPKGMVASSDEGVLRKLSKIMSQ